MNSLPGFLAAFSVGPPSRFYRVAGSATGGSGATNRPGVEPAMYGCTPCILYTEPGPGGRSAGIRTCCSLTCRTTIFGKFKCYEYCTQEVCATFPAGEIIV